MEGFILAGLVISLIVIGGLSYVVYKAFQLGAGLLEVLFGKRD